MQWFEQGNNLRLADTAAAQECRTLLEAVPELIDASVIPFDFKQIETTPKLVAACEFVLEGLYAREQDQPQRRRRLHGGDESEEGSPRNDLRRSD